MSSPASQKNGGPQKIVVVGAGVIGVATAYRLRRDGHDVTLIEKEQGPALETSFANGGQVSAGEVAPWAGPGVPTQSPTEGRSGAVEMALALLAAVLAESPARRGRTQCGSRAAEPNRSAGNVG